MLRGKRKHYRLSVECPCTFTIIRGKEPEEMSPALTGLLQDISPEGLQFMADVLRHERLSIFNEFEKADDPLYKPNLLLLQFSLPAEDEVLSVLGKPQWWTQADLGEPFDYHIGMRFMGTKEAAVLRLGAYIEKHGNSRDLESYARKQKEENHRKALAEKTAAVPVSKYGVAGLPMRFRIVSGKDGKESRSVRALTRNLSVAGLCAGVETTQVDDLHMAFDQDPLMRNKILLEISIPGQTQPVSAIGEVRWVELSTSGDRYKYDAGIKFLRISDQDKYKIAQYIKDKPEARIMEKPA
jgi:hypothetical protein